MKQVLHLTIHFNDSIMSFIRFDNEPHPRESTALISFGNSVLLI